MASVTAHMPLRTALFYPEELDLKRKQRTCALIVSIALLATSLCSTACREKKPTQGPTTPKDRRTIPTTSASRPPHELTPSPTPDPNIPAKDEAIALASEHGIQEEYLRGQYALFLKFSSCIEQNKKLNGYEDIVYAIFPLIADQLTPEREDHFLGKLNTLSIIDRYLDRGVGSQYYLSTNQVVTNATYKNSTTVCFNGILFHELVHFVDTNIDGDIESIRFCENGIFPVNDIEDADTSAYDKVLRANFLIEGGAELYTAKYFTKSTDSYPINVQFFTGIEYLIGQDKLDDIFFSHQTAYDFAKFLLDNGFTQNEVWNFYKTMDSITYNYIPNFTTLRPEEVLIRLYERLKGPNYLEDLPFCHILRILYTEEKPFNMPPSEHDAELSSLYMDTAESDAWLMSMLQQGSVTDQFQILDCPIHGLIIDGSFVLSALVKLTQNTEGVSPIQSLIIDYDFDTKTVRSVTFYEIPIKI